MQKSDGQENRIQLPQEGTKLFKIMRFEDFVNSIEKKYLYFRRVDQYDDICDSDQPASEREKNNKVHFEKDNEISYGDIIDRQRKRTYACCFSTRLTDYLWKTYSRNDPNAVCLVFDYVKMMNHINKIYNEFRVYYNNGNENGSFSNHQGGKNLFILNYGLVEYIDPITYVNDTLQNPSNYSYLKNKHLYSEDNEFRITLFAQGIFKHFKLPNGKRFNFPGSILLGFDFHLANADNIIDHLEFRGRKDDEYFHRLQDVLGPLEIMPNIRK